MYSVVECPSQETSLQPYCYRAQTSNDFRDNSNAQPRPIHHSYPWPSRAHRTNHYRVLQGMHACITANTNINAIYRYAPLNPSNSPENRHRVHQFEVNNIIIELHWIVLVGCGHIAIINELIWAVMFHLPLRRRKDPQSHAAFAISAKMAQSVLLVLHGEKNATLNVFYNSNNKSSHNYAGLLTVFPYHLIDAIKSCTSYNEDNSRTHYHMRSIYHQLIYYHLPKTCSPVTFFFFFLGFHLFLLSFILFLIE